MHEYLVLSPVQLVLMIGLIAVMIFLSRALRVGLEKSIVVAAMRMILQLMLVGFVLDYLFASPNPVVLFVVAGFMIAVAVHANGQRVSHRPRFFWMGTTISIFACVTVSMACAAAILTDKGSWTSPQFFIPFLGLIIGNTLTGVSLGLDSLVDATQKQRKEIECFLALGASPLEAGHHLVKGALKRSLTPILNSMTIAGLVSLPGVMTGQILSGRPPGEAARLQIAIMCLLGLSTFLGSALSIHLVYLKQFNKRHQWVASS